MNSSDNSLPSPAKSRLIKLLNPLFLLLIASLGITKPILFLLGQNIALSDLLFLPVFSIWIICLLQGTIRFRFHKIYWLFVFYFAAMLISIPGTKNLLRSLSALPGEIYLMSLAILTFNLVRSVRDGRRLVLAWLAGTLITVSAGLASILLFYITPDSALLNFTTYHYGAVPVGNYPRLSSLMLTPSMFCNYLVVSCFFLLIARKSLDMNRVIFQIFQSSFLVTAFFTISSGLGAIPLGLGLWFWSFQRAHRAKLAMTVLIAASILSISMLSLSLVALKNYDAPPYVWTIPGSGIEVLPSSRVLVWTASLDTFSQNPFFGAGIGQDACQVVFRNTTGKKSLLTDAHNIYLNVAAQTGITGLIAILLLIWLLVRELKKDESLAPESSVFRIGIGVAFISAFVYQGLVGSFEETRHLWVLIGMVLSFGHSAADSAASASHVSDR